MEETIEDSFGGELDGKERASMEWKKNMDDKHGSLLNINRRGCFPFYAKQTCQPMPSNIIGNYVHGNMTSDSISLQKSSDSLANEATNKLKLGFISTRSVPPQFDNLFVTDPEEDYLDGHNSDSAGSTRYFFQTKDIENNSTASKSTGTDCTILKEGNLDSCDNPLKCQKPSGSLKGSMDTGINDPSCGKVRMPEESCKCSFCLKAAYIWADLHYQDTRAKLAQLKKSKRLARSLKARSCSNKSSIKTAQSISNRSPSLESQLTQEWQPLFLFTENIIVRETAELHDKFLRLKELKENCKRDLEKISWIPS
ncbi:uncharacterized protein LOC121996525 isoform X1 [Zingiber officinale]|uniref:uncharacterized protein LOC121996525 isoform X1 n=1 Tax=Zingiber officinale TaxID=94328 RepID=UPI001C4C9EE1|nr:uncharacterized protein LOC121996525 isoform X1 [Zingiber officinale]